MTARRRSPMMLLAAGCLAGWSPPAHAQTVTVSVSQENFRKEARSTPTNKLATVFEGTALKAAGRQGRWQEVTLEGWIWTASVSPTDREGLDLVVTKTGGENLREQPSGRARRAAVLLRGMLLEKLEERASWTRVRRTGWMWTESLSTGSAGAAGAEATPPDPTGAAAGAPGTPPARPPNRLVVSETAVRLLVAPEGDSLASLLPGADVEVVSREGNWARVRLEGWIWVPATLPADSVTVTEELSVADLRANPERYVGQRVRWQVQYVSLERAEPVRTDFYEGEPFILARAPDRSEGFVYIAVPPELVAEVEQLGPLQTIEVLARVRTGRSALMGVPVLDLIAIQ